MHWPIAVVQIDGEVVHTDRDRLRRAVTRHTETAGFFDLDLAALRAEVRALPWVRDASLRRVWPDTLHVDVREHRPAARYNDAALVSARGAVFRPSTLPAMDLPVLRGPEGSGPAMLERLHDFDQRLRPLALTVAALEQDARGAWRVALDNGVGVRLGRGDIDARLDRFIAVWPRVLVAKAGRIEAVDLRYTNGFAVAWLEGAAPEAREGGA